MFFKKGLIREMLPAKIADSLTKQQITFLEQFFSRCQESFFSNVMLKTYPANHTLIDTNDTCSYVYILLKGRLQAIEESVVDEPYSFTEIHAIEIVGDFELFTKTPSRIITLTTLEKSLFLIIPAIDYISWLKNDTNALFIRTQMLIRQIVSQTKYDRHNFFLDNRTRLLYFLFKECNTAANSAFPVKISFTRQEISNRLGCSLRTVNRAISALQKENILSLRHGKIYISSEQYQFIRKYVNNNGMSEQSGQARISSPFPHS